MMPRDVFILFGNNILLSQQKLQFGKAGGTEADAARRRNVGFGRIIIEDNRQKTVEDFNESLHLLKNMT